MTDLLFASTEADATAAAAIEAHHAEMSGALAVLVDAVRAAAARSDAAATTAARDALARWCTDELLPHAAAEEQALYPAAHGTERGRLLIDAMLAEHGEITRLTQEVATAPDGVRVAAAARSLQVLFGSHLRKENELILPLLTGTSGVSLAELLAGMHAELGGTATDDSAAHAAAEADAGHSCGCGHADEPGYPELDARAVPHAIRHATIFGALGAVPTGGGLLLLAPHDPLPLLAQVEQRWPGAFEVGYVERGPETWRLAFVRVDPA